MADRSRRRRAGGSEPHSVHGNRSVQHGKARPARPELVTGLRDRPKVWHCIYCGWRCQDSGNDYLCKGCGAVRPFVGGSATVVQCPSCDQFSLLLAAYCEWCGHPLKSDA